MKKITNLFQFILSLPACAKFHSVESCPRVLLAGNAASTTVHVLESVAGIPIDWRIKLIR